MSVVALELCAVTGCLSADCPHCRRRRSRYMAVPKQTEPKAITRLWRLKPSKDNDKVKQAKENERSDAWQALQQSQSPFAQARLEDLQRPARYSVRRLQEVNGKRRWRNAYRQAYQEPFFATAPFYAAKAACRARERPSEPTSVTTGLSLVRRSLDILTVQLYALMLTAVERVQTLGLTRILAGVDFRGIRQIGARERPRTDLESQR